MIFRVYAAVVLAAAVTAAQLAEPETANVTQSRSESKAQKQGVLIVGGTYAHETEFPHMTAIGYKSGNRIKYLCGGSLVSSQWVMTAGHCCNKLVPKTVRLGDISPETGSHNNAQSFDVIKIVTHPNYNYPLKYNDIAMLKLSEPVKLNEYVGIACINKEPVISSSYAIASGWGKTESESYSKELRKVELPLTPQKTCVSVYNDMISQSDAFKSLLPEGIKPTMLCAGYKEGGKDTCQGDSGGPLQIKKNGGRCKWVIVGLTSFGNKCAQPNTYAVYTRISSFHKWITSVIGQ